MPDVDSLTVSMRVDYAAGHFSECSIRVEYDSSINVGSAISFALHGLSPSRELACLAEAVIKHCDWERLANPINKDDEALAGAFIEAARAYSAFWSDFDKNRAAKSDLPAVRAAMAQMREHHNV